MKEVIGRIFQTAHQRPGSLATAHLRLHRRDRTGLRVDDVKPLGSVLSNPMPFADALLQVTW